MPMICIPLAGPHGEAICIDPTSHPHPHPSSGGGTSKPSGGSTSSGGISVGSKPGGKSGQPIQRSEEIEKPGIYPEIFADVSILDSIHLAAKGITDKRAQEALQSGVKSALDALWKRTSQDVTYIELSD